MSDAVQPMRGPLAIAGLLVCLAAPFAWIATLNVPWMRSSGFAAWLLLAIGLALGGSAAKHDSRRRTRVLFGVDAAVVALFTFAFFGLARLPRSERAPTLARAPDFTLADERGNAITLSAELARGPVLLVFYRGHW